MLIDARRLPAGYVVNCDICVVGAGAAGITVAHEFVNRGSRVVLLEGGGMKFDSKAQALYVGEVLDPKRHGPLERYRQRRLGGTTTVWGGRCAPLDDIDFERRPHVPYSGWAIRKRDLDPYYARAHEYCHLGAYTYDAHAALKDGPEELVPGFHSKDVLSDRLWRFSLPTDFCKTFLAPLKRCSNVTVYLHANALKIVTRPEGGVVNHLTVGSSGQKTFFVRAASFVLAMGGLETTRLLLVSNRKGIGNDRDLLGRFYTSHMTGDLGEVIFTLKGGPVIWNYEVAPEGVYCKRAMAISEQKQREEGLLNFRAILSYPSPADPSHGNGVISSMYLIKRFLTHRIPPEYNKALASAEAVKQVAGHCANIAMDIPRLLAFSAMWMRKRILSARKYPSLAFESASNTYTLHYDAEQSPNPESRVTLSDQKDAFGMNRLCVDWRCREMDVESVIRSCELIGGSLERSGLGTLLFVPRSRTDLVWDNGVGSHHIGTTRMASNPMWGVVNENCRVFGIDNLYIASSSTFPTSGCANPTLTIVALAIRIADHLKQVHSKSSTRVAPEVLLSS